MIHPALWVVSYQTNKKAKWAENRGLETIYHWLVCMPAEMNVVPHRVYKQNHVQAGSRIDFHHLYIATSPRQRINRIKNLNESPCFTLYLTTIIGKLEIWAHAANVQKFVSGPVIKQRSTSTPTLEGGGSRWRCCGCFRCRRVSSLLGDSKMRQSVKYSLAASSFHSALSRIVCLFLSTSTPVPPARLPLTAGWKEWSWLVQWRDLRRNSRK